MTPYPEAEDVFGDVDATREAAKALYARLAPLTEDTPTWQYITKTRKIEPSAARECADLRYLSPSIDGRPPQDHALVSLLRDPAGEVSGFQLEFCDVLGARTGTQPNKQAFALCEHGVRDGLFHAGGSGDVAYLCEGYSCKALAVASLGLKAYGGGARTVLGCGVPPDATVVVVPDARPDDKVVNFRTGKSVGHEHEADYKRAVDKLLLAGKTVLVAKAPNCGCCKDSDDVLRAHGAPPLRALVEDVTPAGLSLDGEARRLAQIDEPLERDQQTKATAARLKVKVDLLRERVAHYRKAGEAQADIAGDPVSFEDIRPWPHPVDGAQLVEDLTAYIGEHVVVPDHAGLVCALWVLHCHAHDAAYHSPRLVLRSPTKGCGKSTLRRVLSRLVPRPFEAVDITGPTLFRPIGQWHPTVFVDEANEINWSNARDLIGVINSGHCRDDPGVPRCTGENFEVRVFRVWAPLCLALIGFLPAAIGERAITIEMRKKPHATGVRRLLRRDRDESARELTRRAARWALDHTIALENADPDLPADLADRPGDNWRPLLAIADLIGLGDETRKAAGAVSAADDDGEDLGIQLLADIRGIFDTEKAPKLPSSLIVERLLAMEDRPWPEMGRAQRPITTNALARLLRPFKIRPSGTIRIGASTSKGYARASFEATWIAYSLYGPTAQPTQRHSPGAEPVSENSQPSHESNGVTDGIGPKAGQTATCDGVPDETESLCEHQHPDPIADPPSGMGGVQRDDAEPTTITLTCTACGGTFDYPAGKRGRRPSKCQACRDNAAGDHIATNEGDPRQLDIEAKVATVSEVEQVTDEVRAGLRCSYCGMLFTDLDGEPVEIAGKLYHRDDSCAGTIRRRLAAEQRAP
jgi:hypothetical protein